MNPELQNLIDQWNKLSFSDRFVFYKHLQLQEGRNIQFGTATGTKIGTGTTEKLAFWGATPVTRPGAISAPSGGVTVDSQARTAINDIISRLQTLGLTS